MTEITGLPKKDEGFSRLDKLLYTLCSMSNFEGIEVPQSRIEEYYHSLITTNTFNLPIPQSRVEHLLNLIIKGENLGVEVPQSRIEYLLYVLAELIPKEELPFVVTEASSRHERYLWYLIENGGMNLELLTIEFYESETIYNTKDAQVRECEIDGSTILSIEKTKIGTEEFNVITSMASIGTPSDTKMKIEDDVYKSAILSGSTKYHDKITGEIFDVFQENNENLELISSKMPVLSSIGKNLFDGKVSYGVIDGANGKITLGNYFRHVTMTPIKLFKNTPYTFKVDGDGCSIRELIFYNDISCSVNSYIGRIGENDKTRTYTPTQDCYVRFCILKNISGTETKVQSDDYTLQVEQGATATEYEPYKSNILSLPSDLVLRGIGDVKDTLNVNTGEVIERTNQIVNHTSINDTYRHALTNENYFVATFPKIFTGSVDNMWDNSVLVCDKIPTKRDAGNSFGIYTAVQTPLITVPIATIGGDSLELFKQWYANLSPSYVYKLATPVVKTVALSIVDQSGNALEKPIAYEKGHIMLSSNTINPSMKYSLWSSNTYTLSPLKSNNTYTTKSDGSNYILNNVTHSGLNELVTINTLANNKLYTDDSEFKIVYGMHLNEDLSKIHGFATTRSPVLKLEHEGTVNTHSTSNLSLRSVDDGVTEVYDTLNMKTQELIKRCAELVFDGTETNWIFFGDNTNTVGAYMKNIEGMKPDINVKSISNLAIGKGSDALLDEQGAYLRGDSKTLFIKVNKDRLASHDLVGIKQFLADEAAKGTPIRVCYELVEPQTMQVEIESSGDMLTYSDFTNVSVTVEEGSIKPKRVRIKVVTKNTDTLSDMDSLKLTQIDSNKKTQQQSDINIVSMVATSEAFEGSLGL